MEFQICLPDKQTQTFWQQIFLNHIFLLHLEFSPTFYFIKKQERKKIECNRTASVCTPCRVTTSAHQPTCLSVSKSAVAVSLYRWSTLPTLWTYRKRPPVSWLFIHHTLSTAGPWMMSLSLPTQLAWQVRQMRQRWICYLEDWLNVFLSRFCMYL